MPNFAEEAADLMRSALGYAKFAAEHYTRAEESRRNFYEDSLRHRTLARAYDSEVKRQATEAFHLANCALGRELNEQEACVAVSRAMTAAIGSK